MHAKLKQNISQLESEVQLLSIKMKEKDQVYMCYKHIGIENSLAKNQ